MRVLPEAEGLRASDRGDDWHDRFLMSPDRVDETTVWTIMPQEDPLSTWMLHIPTGISIDATGMSPKDAWTLLTRKVQAAQIERGA